MTAIPKRIIYSLSAIAGIALLSLLIIQLQWLRKGVDLHEAQLSAKMGVVTGEIYRSLERYEDFFRNDIQKQKEKNYTFDQAKEWTEIEQVVHHAIDSIFSKYDVPKYIDLIGKRTTGYCPFMYDREQAGNHPDLMARRYSICLCPDMSQSGTLDFAFDFKNKTQYLLMKTRGMLIPSVVFILLLTGILIYLFRIIFNQKKLSELKNDFINNLTHEFKTPIFSIGLSTKLLKNNKTIRESDQLSSYVDLIREENIRLKNQVDKILQMAVIDSGKLKLEKSSAKIGPLIQKVIRGFDVLAKTNKGKIRYTEEGKLPPIEIDETHMTNVIYNLVDNAFKYSKKEPVIEISAACPNGNLLVQVKDHGIGMDPNVQKMIFDKFYREQKDGLHDVKGFGLGLSYVKSIVEMHGGEIRVKSKKGIGTEFIIQIPTRQGS